MAKDRQRWHRARIPGTPPCNPQMLIIIIEALLIHHAMQWLRTTQTPFATSITIIQSHCRFYCAKIRPHCGPSWPCFQGKFRAVVVVSIQGALWMLSSLYDLVTHFHTHTHTSTITIVGHATSRSNVKIWSLSRGAGSVGIGISAVSIPFGEG